MEMMEVMLGMILAGLAIYMTISLIWYIIIVIADWRIFIKAGEAGSKSLIPILNTYVTFKIAWNGTMFWIRAATLTLGSVFTSIAGEDRVFLAIIGAVFALASCIINIICLHKLSKAFGHGILFTLGLLFLNPLFTLILGLGESEYIGPNGEAVQSDDF